MLVISKLKFALSLGHIIPHIRSVASQTSGLRLDRANLRFLVRIVFRRSQLRATVDCAPDPSRWAYWGNIFNLWSRCQSNTEGNFSPLFLVSCFRDTFRGSLIPACFKLKTLCLKDFCRVQSAMSKCKSGHIVESRFCLVFYENSGSNFLLSAALSAQPFGPSCWPASRKV